MQSIEDGYFAAVRCQEAISLLQGHGLDGATMEMIVQCHKNYVMSTLASGSVPLTSIEVEEIVHYKLQVSWGKLLDPCSFKTLVSTQSPQLQRLHAGRISQHLVLQPGLYPMAQMTDSIAAL
jgi:hypothetical protein